MNSFVKKGYSKLKTILFCTFLLTCLFLIAEVLVKTNLNNATNAPKVFAAEYSDTYKFNFGSKSLPEYISVDASTSYTKDRKYGFNRYWDVENSENGVKFLETDIKSNNTFNVDLENGLYEIKVTLGKNAKSSVVAEGTLQLINLTGDYTSDTFQIPITDGQLNILPTDGQGKMESEHSFSSLEIKRISSDATTRPTIWICGDSTSCNYYPKDTSVRTGMGQVLGEYIDTSYYDIKNLASSGQTAEGFVKSGQFEPIEKYGKKDDYLIIAMGINDSHRSDVNTYSTVIKDIINRAKANEMNMFLVLEQGRITDVDPNNRLTDRWFNSTLKQIGQENNLKVIDLFNLSMDYFVSIGRKEASKYYDDHMHCNRAGAKYLASILAKEMNLEANDESESNEDNSNEDNTKYETSDNPEGTYYIQNVATNMYLDVENGSSDNGANVREWTFNKTNSQMFKIIRDEDGLYHILTAASNYTSCIDVENGSSQNGANIMQYKYYGGDMQKFRFEKSSENSYTINTKVTNFTSVLESCNNVTKDKNIEQFNKTNSTNQQFRLIPVK